MASNSGSAAQFSLHTAVGIGEGPSSYTATNDPKMDIPDVMPLGARTATTASRNTAWRLHRNGSTAPQPFAKQTAGSIYLFDE